MNKSVKIRFRLAGDNSESENDENIETIEDDELSQQLHEIFGPNEDSQQSNSTSSESVFQFSIQKSPTRKVMKIHYQDYYRRILESEMKSLLHQNYLNDVQFVCKDGIVLSNSLILGSMSPYLYNILAEVPIVDRLKTVIMPDISSVDLNVLFKLLFSEKEIKQVSVKDMRRIKSLASIFRLEPILVLTRKPGRPKGSQNKPKVAKIVQVSEKVDNFAENVEQIDESSQDLSENSDSNDSNEDLEIFNSATSQFNSPNQSQSNAQSTLNLLPTNDILDQIVQDNS